MMTSVVMLTKNVSISVRTDSCAMCQRTGYGDPVVDFGRPWIALICTKSEHVIRCDKLGAHFGLLDHRLSCGKH